MTGKAQPAHRSAVVTGTGGIGWEVARALADSGFEVILAGRNPRKGAEAIDKIRSLIHDCKVRFEELDLASLESIRRFSERLAEQRTSLDVLINNAAVMRPPQRLETADGLEAQLGINYLGHFALTGRLLPLLQRGTAPRVVTVSSVAARRGVLDLEDLHATRSYHPRRVYSQSKLACLIFALELQRRSLQGAWGVSSLAAHPGIARTNLIYNGPGRYSLNGILRRLLWFCFQPARQGALPLLHAATSAQAAGGEYYGPDQFFEFRGQPGPARIPEAAKDLGAATRLWQVSEFLTGVRFQAEVADVRP